MKLIQKIDGDGFTRVSSMQGLGAEEHYEWKNENSELATLWKILQNLVAGREFKDRLSSSKNEPFHLMLYGLNAESEAGSTVPHCISAEKWKYLSEQLVQCVRKKIGLEESRATSIVILSVRLMVSLPGSKAQPWHLDYSGTSANCQSVFVNISKSVKGNCTEYVEFESSEDEVKCIERARAALLKSGKDPKNPEYLQGLKQGEDDKKSEEDKKSGISLPSLSDYPHSVRFLDGEEGMVFHAETCAKFHRRSANKTDFPRITLGIDYSSKASSATNFVCIDTKHSFGTGGVCGSDIIDSLDDYDLRILD